MSDILISLEQVFGKGFLLFFVSKWTCFLEGLVIQGFNNVIVESQRNQEPNLSKHL